jgi:hypothetical protein
MHLCGSIPQTSSLYCITASIPSSDAAHSTPPLVSAFTARPEASASLLQSHDNDDLTVSSVSELSLATPSSSPQHTKVTIQRITDVLVTYGFT